MPIIAKQGESNFVPAPAGAWAAVCVDVVDLGVLEVSFGGKSKQQHKIRIVWQISEMMANNKPYVVSKRYTLSLHEKAALRKDLESWRGRAFTPSELEGFDVESVLSASALLNILAEEKDGKRYSNVTAVMRLPKTMEAPKPRDYTRVCEREKAVPVTAEYDGPGEEWHQGITDDDVPF
jgi:hypothetical protein